MSRKTQKERKDNTSTLVTSYDRTIGNSGSANIVHISITKSNIHKKIIEKKKVSCSRQNRRIAQNPAICLSIYINIIQIKDYEFQDLASE